MTDNRAADSPLRLTIEDNKMIIRIGINQLDGNDAHPTIPQLKFDNRTEWVKDIISELTREEEDGSSPISDLIDKAMISAIENGTMGLAEDSPTHVGDCELCHDHMVPLRHTRNGQSCLKCSGEVTPHDPRHHIPRLRLRLHPQHR